MTESGLGKKPQDAMEENQTGESVEELWRQKRVGQQLGDREGLITKDIMARRLEHTEKLLYIKTPTLMSR